MTIVDMEVDAPFQNAVTEEVTCPNTECRSQYTLRYSQNFTIGEPSMCPFCGDLITEEHVEIVADDGAYITEKDEQSDSG